MNIFKMSDEEFEKYLQDKIETQNPQELLKKLIECGLYIEKDDNMEKLVKIADLPAGIVIWREGDILGITKATLPQKYYDNYCVDIEGKELDYEIVDVCSTDKWDDCREEKLGCNGCYYNKNFPTPDNPIPIEEQMEYYYDTGEEMLIKGYKDITKEYVSKEYHEMVIKEQNDIIEDLKEKNKKLEEENKTLQDYLDGMEGALKEQIKEQSREITELQEQLQES